jgi:putative ATPase
LLRFSAALDESDPSSRDAPIAAVSPGGLLPSPEEAEASFSCRVFDHILAREPWRRTGAGLEAFDAFAVSAAELLAPGGDVSVLQSPPRLGQRISRILREECGAPPSLSQKLANAEEDFFDRTLPDNSAARWTWDAGALEKCFRRAGFTVGITALDQQEERLILPKDLSLWFDKEKSSWGAFIAGALGEEDFSEIRTLVENRIKEGPITWKWKSLLLKAVKS